MSQSSFGLAVQLLPVNQQVLVLSSLVGMRNGDGWFASGEVVEMFQALRLPPPQSIARSLGMLRSAKLVRNASAEKPWALTPLGVQQAAHVIGDFDYERIETELAGTPGAEYAHAKHTVIPPSFAPYRWQQGITRLLDQFPFETNVFCMTRFPESGKDDPVREAVEALRIVFAQHGLTMHLASDRQAEDDLFGNVGAYMWACQYGIGLLENRGSGGQGLNPNMLIELGSMLIMGRRCAILKDSAAPSPPTDLSGQIYKSVDFGDMATLTSAVHLWISDDLSLGRCASCPVPAPGTESASELIAPNGSAN